MAVNKVKKVFGCSECGTEFPRWQGQCSGCKAWNSISELRVSSSPQVTRNDKLSGFSGILESKIRKLSEIEIEELPRLDSTFDELNRVLGGGFVAGSAVLIGGNPGAGKSTLLLQVACNLSLHETILYVTGEESLQQVAMRADRLNLSKKKLNILSETSINRICDISNQLKPKLIIIDSIQVMYLDDLSSSPGSISQVRESASALTQYAKKNNVIIIMVGHVTKDGSIAGPKVLEHCIDASIMLDISDDSRFRILRSHKNRFGAINELGIFAMTEKGMKEVRNPSAIFLTNKNNNTEGSVISVLWEGTRSLLIELQALVDTSASSIPKRISVGLDQNRLNLMIAILHKHGNIQIYDQDVYINVVGGVKVSETSIDLCLILALVSSLKNKSLPENLVVFGEVGLGGEIRPVSYGQERVREAFKHGFDIAMMPKANFQKNKPDGLKIIYVDKIEDALSKFIDIIS